MKKLLQGILITSLFFCILNVNAEGSNEVFFINKNNVEFTKFQYDTLVDAIGLKGVLNMKIDEYESMEVSLLSEEDTNVEVLEDHDVVEEDNNLGISTYNSLYHETSYKKLTGVTTCKSGYDYCLLNIYLVWKKNPSTRSYDVIGTRIQYTTFYDNDAMAYVIADAANQSVSAQKRETNGRASAIKLPNTGALDYVSFITRLNPGGVAQVSYQHAQSLVARYDALNFEFNPGGLGGVFGYDIAIANRYDGMSGLGLKNS